MEEAVYRTDKIVVLSGDAGPPSQTLWEEDAREDRQIVEQNCAKRNPWRSSAMPAALIKVRSVSASR
jgi:hypothetical protein